ncbi:MAG: hypothetical protein GY711_11615 [bacterium]|nr:hypothetical protein [bacterium]
MTSESILTVPHLMQQRLDLDRTGRASLRGLVPGRYEIAVYPGDLELEPLTFLVTGELTEIELRYRAR